METQRSIDIPAGQEWRFAVPFGSRLSLRLVDGRAEVFGTELALGRDFEFSGKRAAVWTWKGARIEFTPSDDVETELAPNDQMAIYASLHMSLQAQRFEGKSPFTLICGSEASGKTSLAKILVSYAVKLGSQPLIVNLDPRTPVVVPPGALSASVVTHILDIEQGWGSSPISGPAPYHPEQPVLFDFGLQVPSENPSFFSDLVTRLAEVVKERLRTNDSLARSGIFIDTPSSLTQEELDFVIQQFGATVVLVVGSDFDVSFASKEQQETIRLKQNPGAIQHDDAFLRQTQRTAISEYFFGSPRQPLSPYTVTEKLAYLTVYRVLESEESGESRFLTKMEPSAVLQNAVLAVADANPTDDPDVIASAATLGFVHVSDVDEKRQIAKLLLPVPGRMPNRPLIMGVFQYAE